MLSLGEGRFGVVAGARWSLIWLFRGGGGGRSGLDSGTVGDGIHVIRSLNQNSTVTEASVSRHILLSWFVVCIKKEHRVLLVNASCSESIYVSETA